MKDRHLEILGFKVEDKITGFKGVATSVCFDLYGCIQACVSSKSNEHLWYDVARLTIKSKERVMDLPDFDSGYVAQGKKGHVKVGRAKRREDL